MSEDSLNASNPETANHHWFPFLRYKKECEASGKEVSVNEWRRGTGKLNDKIVKIIFFILVLFSNCSQNSNLNFGLPVLHLLLSDYLLLTKLLFYFYALIYILICNNSLY